MTNEKKKKRAPLEAAEQRCLEIGNILENLLKLSMPEGWGFFLILSSNDEDDEGFMTYLANYERAGAIKLLREMADKLERDVKGI